MAVAILSEYQIVVTEGGNELLDGSILIINMGEDESIPSGDIIANSTHVLIRSATANDGFSVCTNYGAAILLDDGRDPALCGVRSKTRQQIHQEFVNQASTFIASWPDGL